MNKKCKIWIGAMLFMTAFSVGASRAQTCIQPPSCDTLGYTMTADQCGDAVKFLKCPLDQSKMFCLTQEEIDPGSSGNAGDILYEDHTTRAEYVYVVDNRAIGVVFDPVNRLAIALDEKNLEWANSSSHNVDIPDLTNCTTNELTCGQGGKKNTEIIMSFKNANAGNNYSYPAAEYCSTYEPSSVNKVSSWFAKGQWFLPNVAELNILYQNKAKVDAALQALNQSKLQTGYYRSSTEYSSDSAWILRMSYGTRGNLYKGYNVDTYVRAVLAF